MATTKKQSSIRLTEDAKELLAELAERLGLSQSAVMETLIREKAEAKGIELPSVRRASAA